MKDTAQILRSIFTDTKIYCEVCKVSKVDDLTCDVTLVSHPDVTIEKVRLKAHLNGDESIIIKPRKESFVLVAFISQTDAFIAMYDQVDEVNIKIGDTVLKINKDLISVNFSSQEILIDKNGLASNMSSGKYEIKNDQDNLKKIIDDLITAITKLTVTTGTGPSGVPINLLDFQNIQQRLPNFFK